MELLLAILLIGGALVGTWAATGALLRLLRARAILDHPNARSSHATPTPRGGGLAVMAVTFACWAAAWALGAVPGTTIGPLIGLALGLAMVSWADDLRGLGPLPRLAAQAAAVAVALAVLPLELSFIGVIDPVIVIGGVGLAWLWFVNLFNFMDGIDGLASVECATVAGGAALVALVGGIGDGTPLLAAILAASALGFLVWNWHPAKLFLGDVGSVPMGFLLGWLLLTLAAHGDWAAAVILPGYFLVDASVTLARRGFRGEAVWRAHHEHFYQQAVQAGASHATVSSAVLVTNLALVGCALLSLGGPTRQAIMAACALVIVGVLLWYLRRADAA